MVNYCDVPIEHLVPHSDPMILVDKVLEYGDNWIIVEVKIKPNAPFFNSITQSIPSWVGIEYMAQTIAVLAGIRALCNNKKVNFGFLLGTRKYLAPISEFKEGQTYQVRVEQLYMDDEGLANFDCVISQKSQVYASAKLNVFETADKNTIIN